MRRPVVLMDVDGPLTESFWDVTLRLLAGRGVDARREAVDQWDVMRALKVPPDVAHEVRAELREPGVASSFEPCEGAKEMLAELRSFARVVAVTAPLDGSPTWQEEREVWLHDRLDFLATDVVQCRDKTLVRGDALVDDKPETVVAWHGAWRRDSVLWRCVHNLNFDWSPALADYGELLDFLKGALA